MNGLLSATVGATFLLAAAASPAARNERAVVSPVVGAALEGGVSADRESTPRYYYFLVPRDYVPHLWDDPYLEGRMDPLAGERVALIGSPEEEAEHLAEVQRINTARSSRGLPSVYLVDLR